MKIINSEEKCWICNNLDLTSVKPSDIDNNLDSSSFAITDADYGSTAEIFRCSSCGFMQCTNLNDVVKYYESLEDTSYEEGRESRSLQSEKIISNLLSYKSSGRLLDIGAGSGILVEKANEKGFQAEGVEPSTWLSDQAKKLGLTIHNTTLPIDGFESSFDVVTLIDVIEHVSNPVEVLTQVYDILAEDGVGILVTPDASSLMARLLGWKWWHYRVAHIGYFNLSNLKLAFAEANLQVIEVKRPSWYFTIGYLAVRVQVYLPSWIKIPIPSFLTKTVVPLNLGDSLLVYFKRL